jgi:AmiR/NasT family two-component response regulator
VAALSGGRLQPARRRLEVGTVREGEMKRLRVLIADDESAVREMLAEMCRALGHVVVGEARDGREALQLADDVLPDLVLLDIKMPEMDGIEASRMISQKWNVPVLIVTAYADDQLMRQAAESGAFNYIIKPLTKERLAAAISMALARFTDLQGLKEEVGDLKQSLEDRRLIERAKGILMRDMRVGEQEAFAWLKRTSSHHNTRLGEVARRVVSLELNKGPRTR